MLYTNELFEDRSDQAIIKLVLDGNKDLFELLIKRYERRLIGFLMRMTGSFADAQDLAQETFINAYFNLSKFDIKKSYYPWLFTIAYHLAVNHFHKNGKIRLIDIEKVPEVPIAGGDGFEQLLKKEDAVRIREVLSKLDVKYRVILELRYFNDKSYEEIAEILQIPINTVKSRLFRAKSFVATRLGTLS